MNLLLTIALLAGPPSRDFTLRELSNGLDVLVVVDHALPLATVEIGVRNGSMNEPPALNGLSHLYEHMFFKGNKVIPSQEAFLQKSRDLGMVFNGSTETERVNYYFTTTADRLRPSLSLMRDAIEFPLFDPGELRREEQVVIGEIDRDDSDPFYHFGHAMDLAMWKYPSFKDPLGNRATVAAATVEKMRLIQSRYYVPNNSVLVIAGDVDAEAVFGMVQELFEAWPRAADPFVAHPVEDEPPLERSKVVVVAQPVQTVDLGFEWQGPSIGPASTREARVMSYAADLLSTMVALPGSRFQRDLVDSGACLRADFSWSTQAHIGPISYGLEATPDGHASVDRCVSAAVHELGILASPEGFSDDDLRDAQISLEVHKAIDREVTSQYAHLLTFFWSSTGLDYYEGYLDGMRTVTRADIQAFLKRYVVGLPGQPPPKFVFGALMSPGLQAREGLNEAHFEALLGLAKGSM